MTLTVQVEVHNLKDTQRILEKMVKDMQGPPMVQGMKRATLLVARDAKKNAPVNTGRLRASIAPEVRVEGNEVQGIVGSNVYYAPFMELGTRPHFPPLAPIIRWVHLKRMAPPGKERQVAFAVALAISRRGLAPRRFLQNALEKNAEKIVELIGITVGRIIRRAH